MIYFLLSAGLFLGWSMGANDGANAFGTAVGTGIINYRKAVTIIAIFVIIGAYLGGASNLSEVSEIAVSNRVLASEADIRIAAEEGLLSTLRLNSAIKSSIVLACAGVTIFIMSYLKFPVSTSQAITGAVIGWGLIYADYGDRNVLRVNLPQIGRFVTTWVINPLSAGIISFALVWISKRYIEKRLTQRPYYEVILKLGYVAAGILASFSIGINSPATVTAFYYDTRYAAIGVASNLLTDARFAAILGGISIALGVVTFSRGVMTTVGADLAKISPVDGFLVVISMALTVLIVGGAFGIPLSTSQAMVGAVIGAGLAKGVSNVNFKVFKRIGFAWILSPFVSCGMTYLAALLTKRYFV